MNEPLFKIGSVYRQKDGKVVLLREHPTNEGRAFACIHYGDGVFSSIIDGDGARRLDNGEFIWRSTSDEDRYTLIPGELHQVDGAWVPVEEKAVKTCPGCGAAEGCFHDEACHFLRMHIDPNEAMIARDGAPKPTPTPIPAAPQPTSLPAVNGLTVVAGFDHKLGAVRFVHGS